MKLFVQERIEELTPEDVEVYAEMGKTSIAPISGTVTITPETAQYILETRNKLNRKIKKNYVKQYAEAMTNGKWVFSDPIMFNNKGLLDNGQHRLTACVIAGVPFNTTMSFGVTSQMNTDNPAVRSASDNGRMCYGREYETRFLSAIENMKRIVSGKYVKADSEANCMMYDKIRETIEGLQKIPKQQCSIHLNTSSTGAMYVMALHGFSVDEIADMTTVWRTADFSTKQKAFLRPMRENVIGRKEEFDPKRSHEGAHRTTSLMIEYVRYFYPYLNGKTRRVTEEEAEKLVRSAYEKLLAL